MEFMDLSSGNDLNDASLHTGVVDPKTLKSLYRLVMFMMFGELSL